MNKKRRNHYVWKHYLRPWSVRHKIWCLIKNEMIEKRLDDIAVEKDFYKRRPPTKNDIVKLEYMISKMRVPFQELGKEWLTLFQTHDLVKNLIEENKTLSNLIKENKTLPISPFSPNFIEEIHTKIEKNGKKYLDLILKENLSFLDSPNDFYEFISFFSAQLFRTKKYRDALLENSNDLENIWGISSLILQPSLSHPYHSILNYHNFILTPHTAWIGLSTIKRAWNQVLENIENFKKGKPSRVVC